MDDDFNTGGAFGELFEVVRALNRAANSLTPEDAAGFADYRRGMVVLKELTQLLGLFREIREAPKAASDGLTPGLLDLLVDAADRRARGRTSSCPTRSATSSAPSASFWKTGPTARSGGSSRGAERVLSHCVPGKGPNRWPKASGASKAEILERVPGRVVGVDPGLNVTGYAVLDPSRRGAYVVEAGVIRTKGAGDVDGAPAGGHPSGADRGARRLPGVGPGPGTGPQPRRHPRTAILMAHARGVIVLAAVQRGLTVFGYAAARIKKTLTGSGKAPKEQMQHAIKTELGLELLPEPHDVADACAVALCHFQIARNKRAVEEH